MSKANVNHQLKLWAAFYVVALLLIGVVSSFLLLKFL